MATATKPRQPRLRASCDGCFLAKVKCSKARPICSRCLACGIECRYSPSSRAGKPKSDQHSRDGSSNHDMSGLSPVSDDKGMVYSGPTGLYRIESGWSTPPAAGMDGGLSRSHSISSDMAMLIVDERSGTDGETVSAGSEMYSTGMPWTPPDLSSNQFTDAVQVHPAHTRSQSFDMTLSAPMPTWADPSRHDMMSYPHNMPTPGSMTSNFFPSPSATPTLRPAPPMHKSSSTNSNGTLGSCTCFTACLQSLQALHNASSPASPPLDHVLSLNSKAVEGCAAMLACSRCMSRSGTHTAAMLLGTVIGKITSFYNNASHCHFEHGGLSAAPQALNGLGVSLGAYHVNGEDGRWLELEILARELRKLEEVYARFREVCADLSEDQEVSKAMLTYLGQNIQTTLEVVSHRKGNMAFV